MIFPFEIGWFHAVDADVVAFSVALDHEELVSPTENREGALVGGLERFPDRVIAYEHVGSRVQIRVNVRRFVLGASRDRAHVLHEFA